MAKNQLHQLLAVESDLRQKAKKITEETITTFNKRADHFDGIVKQYVPYDEEADKIPPEIKQVVTTVDDKLFHTQKALIQAIDAQLSKEQTNASGTATAVLDVGGAEYTLSAQALLSLEKTLVVVRALYDNVPTLDPTKKWVTSEIEAGIYESNGHQAYRKEKRAKVIELAPATKEHPAQAELTHIDEQVGTMTTDYKTGRVTPRQKSEWLERIDELIGAVKKARSRANQAEVINIKIATDLFRYIDKG